MASITRISPVKSHWPLIVYERAQELYNEQPTPTPTQLTNLLSKEQETLGHTPGESTIRQWIAKRWITLNPEDAPWSLVDAEAEEAALVLPLIRWAADHGKPRPSKRVCRWIVLIRRIAGVGFDLESVYDLAQHARRGGGDVERVEEYLSYEPWTEAGQQKVADAINAGRTSFGIVFMSGGIEPRRKDGRDG